MIGSVAAPLVLLALLMLSSWVVMAEAVWVLASPFPLQSLPVLNTRRFVSDLQAWSSGRIQIEILPPGRAPAHQNILHSVGQGRVQMGEFLLAVQRQKSELFAVDTVPFLAITHFKARRLWEESYADLARIMARDGAHVLLASPLPAPGLFSARPLTRLADFAGLRIWAPDESTAALAVALGGVAVKKPAGAVRKSMSQGDIEAMFVSPQAGVAMQAWDLVPYFLDVPAWIPKSALVVNVKAYQALSAPARDALTVVTQRANERAWRTAYRSERDAVTSLRERGISVLRASPALRQELLNVGRDLTAVWTERAGDRGIGVVDRFISIQLKN
jgi:TRAP-type C4-dicarboxylate transport system substrate-binding protein